jgi:hypothetical protein
LALCLLSEQIAARAQFVYSVANGAITIAGYSGPGGAVAIPSAVNGLPVTSIGDYAFYFYSAINHDSLTNVTIPDSVTNIGDYAFLGCRGLRGVTIGNGVTCIGYYAFCECTSLAGVTIGNGVTCIGAWAFESCSNLTVVTIPSSVTSIETETFEDCTSLSSVTIGKSLTNIADDAFLGCSGLTAFTVDPQNTFYSSLGGLLFNKNQTTLVESPPGKGGAYTIPSSVTSIGDDAFYGCTGLTSVTIGSGVTSIGDAAFWGCSSLTSVTIPDSVTSIGNGVFMNCGGLTSVTIGSSVTSIGGDAFYGCTGLTSVTIGSGVTSIGYEAFFGCTGLTSVTIPSSVTGIGDAAFWGCSSLTSVTIPDSVTNIGDCAFDYRTNLTSAYFQGDAPSADSTVFAGDNYSTIYYLPGTTGWGPFFAERPAVLWNPQVQTGSGSFGVRAGGFGFTITSANNLTIVVEASTSLAAPSWVPLQTNSTASGPFCFSDPGWTNFPTRFYRVRAP